jgi:archaellum component FlaG (FlaF/FlaG flagellin family)
MNLLAVHPLLFVAACVATGAVAGALAAVAADLINAGRRS